MVQHYDWARYGLVTTSDDTHLTNGQQWENQRIVPLGSPYAEFASALSSLSTHSTSNNDLTETITNAYSFYLMLGATADDTDDDGDGFTEDWNEAPIEYSCQDTHIIVFTNAPPSDDEDPTAIAQYDMLFHFLIPISTRFRCLTTLLCNRSQCYYDQQCYISMILMLDRV